MTCNTKTSAVQRLQAEDLSPLQIEHKIMKPRLAQLATTHLLHDWVADEFPRHLKGHHCNTLLRWLVVKTCRRHWILLQSHWANCLEAALPACPLKKTKGALKPSETPDANDIELRANALAGQVPASLEKRMEPRARSREATMTHL